MSSEEFTIYGVFSEFYTKGCIESDKFKLLMVDYLSVYYLLLYQFLILY